MPLYHLQALSPQGKVCQREVTANSEADAKNLLQQEGLTVLACQAADNRFLLFPSWQKNRFDVILFSHELMALLGAGLSLIEALETLSERESHAQEQAILQPLIKHMYQGLSFSAALNQFPDIFPALFIATIAASEQTGEMVDALSRYLAYQQQLGILKDKIVSAAIYPALLLGVGSLVAMFLLCYLVPRFSSVYENLDTELPLASKLLMDWGLFASQHPVAVSLSLLALVSLLAFASQQRAVHAYLSQALYNNRWLGANLQLMQLARFYRSLSLLLRGGIPILKALDMTQGLLPLNLQQQVKQAIEAISVGQRLSVALEQAKLSTPVALRLIRAGERNGQLPEMLEQTASFHEHELSRWIDGFTRLFEPLLMLFIGLLIGGIVILLYLPIFELASSVQ